jgi:hypothetical protein
VIIGVICPTCTTAEEHAEKTIRDAVGPKYTVEGLRPIEQPKFEPPYWVAEDPPSDDEGDGEHKSHSA